MSAMHATDFGEFILRPGAAIARARHGNVIPLLIECALIDGFFSNLAFWSANVLQLGTNFGTGMRSLMGTAMQTGLLPAAFVLAGGTAIHYATRGGKRISIEEGAAMLSLAWLARTAGAVLAAVASDVVGSSQSLASTALPLFGLVYGCAIIYLSLDRPSTARSIPVSWKRHVAWTLGLVIALSIHAKAVAGAWEVLKPVQEGQHLPTLSLRGVNVPDGGPDLSGRVVLIDFWATWCQPCVESLPALERLHQAYKSRGFSVVAVNVEAGQRDDVRGFLMQHQYTMPVYIDEDGALGERFGVSGYPNGFVVDRSGTVRFHYIGPPSPRALEETVSALLGEEVDTHAEHRADEF